MNRNRLGNCIDWVFSIVFSVCLWMVIFNLIVSGDYLAATNFMTTLVNVVLLMMVRKEAGNGKK